MPRRLLWLATLAGFASHSTGGGGASRNDAALLTPIPPFPGAKAYAGKAFVSNTHVPFAEVADACQTKCACPPAAKVRGDASSACCVWEARVLAKEQRPNGCSLTLAFGDASRPLPAKFKGDVVLGVHEELSAAHGVSGSVRCTEFEPLPTVAYFSGVIVASNPSRIYVDAKRAATAARLGADARATEDACSARFIVDDWWASSEWAELRNWVRAEIESEAGHAQQQQQQQLLLQQLNELDSWATAPGGGDGSGGRQQQQQQQQQQQPPEETGGGAGRLGAIRAELERIYRAHNPAKASEVVDLLAKYVGSEEALLQSVREKYAGKGEL